MAITNYKKQVEQPDDDYRALLCTEPGCGRRWSVNLGAPKCSMHQWPDSKKHDDFVARQNYMPKEYNPADPRAWAKRIIDKHEAGLNVNPTTLKFAQEALR